MAKVKVEVSQKEVKAVISELNKKMAQAADIIFESITIAVEDIAAEASARVPVDTGILKNSIDKNVVENAKTITGEVRVGASYAPYVEFGTGGLVNVPKGLEDYAVQFKGAGKREVNLPARAFLFPAFFKSIAEMKTDINEKLKKITD